MFKKYNSIENSYRSAFIEKLERRGMVNEMFVVQEKVHGANLSYWTTDGVNFQAAKRNGVLEAGEKFYNYEVVLESLKSKFANIWNQLKSKNSDLNQLTFFGEIMGGNFPKDKTPDGIGKQAIKVQKGIFYSPENHFYAFDILINQDTYLNVDIANTYFEAENIFHAKTLFQGNLEECLKYPNIFNSVIPAQLGFPTLENNICEGVIIRPIKAEFLNGGNRVILKNKNDAWAENKRFDKSFKQAEPLPEKIVKLQEAAETFITENRLNNVISKIGAITEKDFGKVLGLFNKDILEDFQKDFGEFMEELDKKERKLITKSVSKKSAILIRNYFRR